jgi:hypothetical protein
MADNSKDAENYEKTKEIKMNDETPPPRDGMNTEPSAEDRARRAGSGGDLPGKDEIASESNTPPENLHGSLHGRWEKGDQKAK